MKKVVLSLLVAIAFCLSVFSVNSTLEAGCSHNFTIINIHDLTDDVFLHELIQGKYPDIVIEVPAHTILPYSLIFGDFGEFKGNVKNRIETEKTIKTDVDAYLRYIPGKVLESDNLVNWESTVDIFWNGIRTGLIELSISAKK